MGDTVLHNKSVLIYLQVDRQYYLDPKLNAEWASKKLVWVPHAVDGFCAATIINECGDEAEVEYHLSEEKTKVSKSEIRKTNPYSQEMLDDLATLSVLNDASILYNIKQRYHSDMICTYSGLFCVVVNPYKEIPIYSNDLIHWYKGRKRHERPPHIYSITECAYRSMIQDREDQSLLCTGESGAGKTETTKKIIQYLATVAAVKKPKQVTSSKLTSTLGEVESQLLEANPILESFGNAKTVINDNSSRFGKFIRINFDTSGLISGANLETYLLEKARVVSRLPGERNFHIFYQLLAGASSSLKREYLLEEVNHYLILNDAQNEVASGMKDAELFEKTNEALKVVGFNDDEKDFIFRVISGILQMGNIVVRGSDQAIITDNTAAQKVAHLIKVSASELTNAFLRPRIKVGRDFINKTQSKEQAEFQIIGILKALYERLFRWIVSRINRGFERAHRGRTITFFGILDIAGFEVFEINTFEQLCVNYTNEKLQQLFNHTMFVSEQEEYRKEGIDWKFIDFQMDIQPVIDLIEKPMGLLSLLDEECWFPKANEKSLVEKFVANHENHPKFERSTVKSNSDFRIIHYAGLVEYTVTGWLIKNTDPINENVIEILRNSSDKFMQTIFKKSNELLGLSLADINESTSFANRSRKSAARTASAHFKSQLNRLMSLLNNTKPSFVRCIIPNQQKRPGKFDGPMVLNQLKCNGVLEGIRICRQGYPTRMVFQEFKQRYEMLCPNVMNEGFMDAKKAVTIILETLNLEQNCYRIGISKVFFRAGILAQLEEERDNKLVNMITDFQSHCRGYLARKNFQKHIENINATRIIQRNCDAYLRLRHWSWWKLFLQLKPLLVITSAENTVKEKEGKVKDLQQQLDQTSNELKEIKERVSHLEDEHIQLHDDLRIEKDAARHAEQALQRLKEHKLLMEEVITELESKLSANDDMILKLTDSNAELKKQLEEATENLKKVEQAKEKLEYEKSNLEKGGSIMKSNLNEYEEQAFKLNKEKKNLEERISQLNMILTETEEKVNQLTKAKAKQQTVMAEMEEKYAKERDMREELERAKRRLEQDIREKTESSSDVAVNLNNTQLRLKKLESDYKDLLAKSEEEAMAKVAFQKQYRDLESKLEDAKDDLESEKQSREKIEKAKLLLSQELESLKLEVMSFGHSSEAQQGILRKRESELSDLRLKLEAETKLREVALAELKRKHALVLEENEGQIDQLKRTNVKLEKSNSSLETECNNFKFNIKVLQDEKLDLDKKLKLSEQEFLELQSKYHKLESSRNELQDKVSFLSQEVERLQKSNTDSDSKLAGLQKQLAQLQHKLMQVEQDCAEETRLKLTAVKEAKESLQALDNAKENISKEATMRNNLEKQNQILKDQIQELTKRLEESKKQLDQSEESKKKVSREFEESLKKVDDLEAKHSRLEKTKKMLQSELDDISVALEKSRSDNNQNDRKTRKLEQSLSDAKKEIDNLNNEKDLLERENRQKETAILVLQGELDELTEKYEESENARESLSNELETLVASQDDAGKNTMELERAKISLENEVTELRQQVFELEDEMAAVEQMRDRLEVSLQALRTQNEQQTKEREVKSEENRRNLSKINRQLESDLEQERRNVSNLEMMKRTLELDVEDVKQQLEISNKIKDESLKQSKKFQQLSAQLQKELDTMNKKIQNDVSGKHVSEKQMQAVEMEKAHILDEFNQVNKEKKLLTTKVEELEVELSEEKSLKSLILEEKSMCELRINRLENEIEDLRENTVKVSEDRVKRAQAALESAQTELLTERQLLNRTEMARATAERQLKDAREKIQEIEKDAERRRLAEKSIMEKKFKSLEEVLDQADNDKQALQRQIKKIEKKVKDTQLQVDEERNKLYPVKDQLDKAVGINKKLKRDIENLEDDNKTINSQLKKVQRELKDTVEIKKNLEIEVDTLRSLKEPRSYSLSRKPGYRSMRSMNDTDKMSTSNHDSNSRNDHDLNSDD